MSAVRILPDDLTIDCAAGETVLQAALRAGIALPHACGAHARCTTCRIEVQEGIVACSARSAAEQALADRLGFAPNLRLACQLVPGADSTVRRLVFDDDDIALVDQRGRSDAGVSSGEERDLAILFSDIRGFTAFSETLPPHDVVHLLNRYFHLMGPLVRHYGGSINNYMGDGLMALFGLSDDDSEPTLHAVQCGLAMLAAMDRFKSYLDNAYGRSFDIGVGIHVGDAVVGSVGALGEERVTAIGDSVNFASRIESANKPAGTRLLVSAAVRDALGEQVQWGRSLRTSIAGKQGEYALHEVVGLA